LVFSRISPVTFLAILISLATIVTAAGIYNGDVFPYNYESTGEPGVPLSSWAGSVVGAASSRGEGVVEGRPAAYGRMGLPEVNGTVIMPKPGLWETDGGEELCHMDVLDLIAGSDYIVAKGVIHGQLVYMHAEPHKALVATDIQAYRQGVSIHVVYKGPGMCGWHHHGGMGRGMGEGGHGWGRWGMHDDGRP